jgi:hypothetical protein
MAIVQKLLPIRRTDFSPQIRGHSNRLVLSPSNYSLTGRCEISDEGLKILQKSRPSR